MKIDIEELKHDTLKQLSISESYQIGLEPDNIKDQAYQRGYLDCINDLRNRIETLFQELKSN